MTKKNAQKTAIGEEMTVTTFHLPKSLLQWIEQRRKPARSSRSKQMVLDLELLQRMLADPMASQIVEKFRV